MCTKDESVGNKKLLKYEKVDPSASDNLPLKFAIMEGMDDLIVEIIRHPRFNPNPMNEHILLWGARFCTSRKTLISMLYYGKMNPTLQDNALIRTASASGNEEWVEQLLRFNIVDPSARNSEAFQNACFNGYTNIAKRLLKDKRVDPHVNKKALLKHARKKKYRGIEKNFIVVIVKIYK